MKHAKQNDRYDTSFTPLIQFTIQTIAENYKYESPTVIWNFSLQVLLIFFILVIRFLSWAGFPAFFFASIVLDNFKLSIRNSHLVWRGSFRLRSSGTSADRQLVRTSQ
jgi:hypothetical protein